MQTAHGNLHLKIQTSRKSPVGIKRTAFRREGKVLHIQLGRITGCSLMQLKLLQLAFREQMAPAVCKGGLRDKKVGTIFPQSAMAPGSS